ncbi:MAG: ABC transporter ATP-binding protein [Acidimicrobiia bacterium]|nr:ABC transporter ATP-binding protein [Acidimicrobiia bacterium]
MSIELERAAKTYGEGTTAVHALKETTVSIPDGQFAVILGPSGSGKTTLLNLIGSIDSPTSGVVRVGDVDVGALDADAKTVFRRTSVGFVFQFFNLIPTLTALENVELAAELTANEASARARRALDQVGLSDRLDHFPGQLSGGEQQRVAIARALSKQTPLLLCDEPTGELDFETGRLILDLLYRLNREEGKTVLVVTHNAVIGDMADRVIRLHSGEVADDHLNRQPVAAGELNW